MRLDTLNRQNWGEFMWLCSKDVVGLENSSQLEDLAPKPQQREREAKVKRINGNKDRDGRWQIEGGG